MLYGNFPKFLDIFKNVRNPFKIRTLWCYHTVMSPKDADIKANCEDPDQTAQEQSDLGLHFQPRPICFEI